jgi:hypothetical protein
MKKDWPIYFNLIRRLLVLKGLKPTDPATIAIIGRGWQFGESALTIANRIIALHEANP